MPRRKPLTSPVPEPNVLLPFIDLTAESGQAFFLWSPAPENSKNVSASALAHPCSSIVLAYGAEIGDFHQRGVKSRLYPSKEPPAPFDDYICEYEQRWCHITESALYVTFVTNFEVCCTIAPYIGMTPLSNNQATERLNPLNDYLFYKVMGEPGDEPQLLGFLNAVLGRSIHGHSSKKAVKDLEIQENNFFAADTINGKSCILDVRATLEDGTKVNIEVQLRNEHNMDRRSLFYWSRMYAEGFGQGQDYKDLPNVIAINIVDFDFPAEGNYHSCFHLREDSHPDLIMTTALEIHFINMVKWSKLKENDLENDSRNNPLHRWLIWFDKKSPPELIQEVVNMDSAIMSAEAKLAFFSQDKDERDRYFRRLMATMDYNSGMNSARREGLEAGQETATLSIARKALAEGALPEFVQKITGLDMETIQQLAKEPHSPS